MQKREYQNDPVHCAIGLRNGIPLHYGRAAVSGDWYIGNPLLDYTIGTIKEAEEAGERVVWHPDGPPMFRLDWLVDGDESRSAEIKQVLTAMDGNGQKSFIQ